MDKLLTIPEEIRVGFQKREDTYTGQLAFVIRKERTTQRSWETWRDKDLPAQEYPNLPTEGFVLNKTVGGQRFSDQFHARNEAVRVFDPRGFEFEISTINLLFILSCTDCSRGKGLEGKFVYGWSKGKLVLLPVGSREYRDSVLFTSYKESSIPKREIVPGRTYQARNLDILVYLGEMPYHFLKWFGEKITSGMTAHIFYKDGMFLPFLHTKHLARVVSSDVVGNYAELLEAYQRNPHGSRPLRLEIRNERFVTPSETIMECWRETETGHFQYFYFFLARRNDLVWMRCAYELFCEGGALQNQESKSRQVSQEFLYGEEGVTDPAHPVRTNELWAITENGTEFRVDHPYSKKTNPYMYGG